MDFETLKQNWDAQPYRGYYVNHKGRAASMDSVELISHIEDNLYVGGCQQGVDLEDFFDHVFSLYMWEEYMIRPTTARVTYKMYDTTEGVAAEDENENPVPFYKIVEAVSDALDTGGNVLVHCQAGINRSNLVAAGVLVHRGRSPQEAIDLLREKRGQLVLSNPTFEDYILGIGAEA